MTYSVVAVVVAWGEPEKALPSVVDAQSCWTFKIDWTVYFGVGILQVWRGNKFGRMVAFHWYWRVSTYAASLRGKIILAHCIDTAQYFRTERYNNTATCSNHDMTNNHFHYW